MAVAASQNEPLLSQGVNGRLGRGSGPWGSRAEISAAAPPRASGQEPHLSQIRSLLSTVAVPITERSAEQVTDAHRRLGRPVARWSTGAQATPAFSRRLSMASLAS